MALEEKGIKYQYKEVNPYRKEAAFLAVNPKGLVPAVKHRGQAMYESSVLLEVCLPSTPCYGRYNVHLLTLQYLDEAFPETRAMLPSSPADRALARIQVSQGSRLGPESMEIISSRAKPKYFCLQIDYISKKVR